MVRSIGAVVAGYFVFGASAVLLFQLSGRDPHDAAPIAFMAAATIWGAVFAMVGGWLAGHVSVRRPAAHAASVAALIALAALASMLSASGAIWSEVSALVVMAPCAWLGGVLAAWQKAG